MRKICRVPGAERLAAGWAVGFMLASLMLAPAFAVEEVNGIPVPVPRPLQAEAEAGADTATEPAGPDTENGGPAEIDPEDVITPRPRPDRLTEGAPDEAATPAEHREHKQNAKPADDAEAGGRPEPAGKNGQAGGADYEEPSLMPPPRPAKMPADELACRARLTELGVAFQELPQLADEAGCSVPWPISVTSLSRSVQLAPAAQLNCATALAAAGFVAGTIAPKAKEVFGAELIAIRQDSAYVCRPRNGTSKLSEHAFGNALDIGAFTLSDERQINVGKAVSADEAAFMLAIRLAACGPFRTVLGPGSDRDHATHFHFDLQQRRSGSTFCQ